LGGGRNKRKRTGEGGRSTVKGALTKKNHAGKSTHTTVSKGTENSASRFKMNS